MKLLAICATNPFATPCATNNRFLALAEGLIENGCTLDCLILRGTIHKKEREKFAYSGVNNNIRYQYLLPFDCSNFLLRQFYFKIFTSKYYHQKIRRVLMNNKYDYVWLNIGVNDVEVGLRLFRSNPELKFFHERSEFSWIGGGTERLHKRYLEEFLYHIDIMSVMTQSLKSYYKNYLSENAKMIHLPMTVDFSRFLNIREENDYKKPYIAYCGTMNNCKDGVNILIQSFLSILVDFPEIHLYLAGPLTPKRDYLKQMALIEKSNAKKRITYLGILERHQIPPFLFNASVLALARPESKQAEGGFPTKLGEYLATGKPVCVTAVGEIPYYLKDGESAYIATPDSVSSFAEILRTALTSAGSLNVGDSGRRVAMKNFNKDIQGKLLFDCLDRLDKEKKAYS